MIILLLLQAASLFVASPLTCPYFSLTHCRCFTQGFGPAVTSVLREQVLQAQGGMDAAQASAFMSDLLAQGRLIEELSD